MTQYQGKHLKELQGDVSETAIKYSLGLLPPFLPGDVVHDNACGNGAVTKTIMEVEPPNIKIDATDINPQFVASCAASAEKYKWPVTAAVMSAQEITFPANRFTHSFTCFAFHCIGDHDAAAKQVYRTLKSDGTAIASIWTYMPHVNALHHAHWRTRGEESPMPLLLPLDSFREKDLRKTLEAGGFEKSKINCYEHDFLLKVQDLKRWAQLAWSYLGALESGWCQNDEDKWDEAIADIVEQLDNGDGISKNDEGETVLRMAACIAIAKKSF